jgi:Flp pilus assembly protein TadD
MNPEHFGARLGLANTYIREDPGLTERTLTELMRDHPGSPSGYSSLQYLYFQLGRYEEAVEPARWAVRLSPNNETFKFSLSSDLILAGMFSEAKTLLLGMLEEGTPRTGDVQSNLATVYFFEGDYGDAAELYRIAIEHAPNSATITRNLGDAIWHLEGKIEAEPIFREVVRLGQLQLEINPDDTNVLSSLVVAWGSLGDEIQLEANLQRSLSVASADPQMSYDGAVAYSRVGKLEIARGYVIRARDLGYPEALLQADPDIRLVGVELENLDTEQIVN